MVAKWWSNGGVETLHSGLQTAPLGSEANRDTGIRLRCRLQD